jgi:hypothetical protein
MTLAYTKSQRTPPHPVVNTGCPPEKSRERGDRLPFQTSWNLYLFILILNSDCAFFLEREKEREEGDSHA